MKKFLVFFLSVLLLLPCFSACGATPSSEGSVFSAGYGEASPEYGDLSQYYMAGFEGGRTPEGILDSQKVKALWLDNGVTSVLLITVDCIGLDRGTVAEIRAGLRPFVKETGCDSVNVISTHTHAGVDTLGLWGEVGRNGKNQAFQEQLISLSVSVASAAYADRTPGKLFFSAEKTRMLQTDSRSPGVFDSKIYQLRFVPEGGREGIRLVSFAAHAETLWSQNLLISADFPGALANLAAEKTGDRLLFVPGAIGGLIMPQVFSEDRRENMEKMAEKLWDYLSSPGEERELTPTLKAVSVTFDTELENTLFLSYKFLGILQNPVKKSLFSYRLTTELTLFSVGDVTFALFPGEIFPELISGEGGLQEIAEEYGFSTLVPVGLANDEIGYIIPEEDFVLHPDAPYAVEAEGHYEETNSVGPDCAADLQKAFRRAAKKLQHRG